MHFWDKLEENGSDENNYAYFECNYWTPAYWFTGNGMIVSIKSNKMHWFLPHTITNVSYGRRYILVLAQWHHHTNILYGLHVVNWSLKYGGVVSRFTFLSCVWHFWSTSTKPITLTLEPIFSVICLLCNT